MDSLSQLKSNSAILATNDILSDVGGKAESVLMPQRLNSSRNDNNKAYRTDLSSDCPDDTRYDEFSDIEHYGQPRKVRAVKISTEANCHDLGDSPTKKPRLTRTIEESIASCGKSYLAFSCPEDQHLFYKKIFCGSPACPTCRKSDWKNDDVSVVVRRRVARTWDKVMWARGFYKVTVTFPQELNDLFWEPKSFTKLFNQAGDFIFDFLKLKEKAALISFHPVGNKRLTYHPHFEILIPFDSDSWIDPYANKTANQRKEFMKSLRESWSMFLLRKYRKALNNEAPKSHIYFSFADSQGYMVHRVRYAVDFHWAKNYEGWSDEAKLFLEYTRRSRWVRGYGMLSDRKWKAYVMSKEYYYESFKDKDFNYENKCPVCGGKLEMWYKEDFDNGKWIRNPVYLSDEVPKDLEPIEKTDLLYSPQAWGPLKEAG